MTKSGIVYKFGDVVLVEVPFTDSAQVKLRPALVLFEELDNVVVAGITSNRNMKGIIITEQEGLVTDSVIKINYIFTVAKQKIKKLLISLSEEKKEFVRKEIRKKLGL
jgi:mRNA interferase MazF